MTILSSERRAQGGGTRRPRLALAAGLLMPGLGQLYAGDVVRGALVLFAVALAVPAAARLALVVPPCLFCFVLMAGVVAAVTVYVAAAVDALRQVRRHPSDGARPWQRPGVYALYTIIAYVFVLTPLTAHVRDHLVETFVVPSASMSPTILPGDRILVDKTAGRRDGQKLWRGAIAVFVYPNDRTSMFVKRIIGLPGDRISIEGRRLLVNGKVVTSEATERLPTLRERGDRGEYDVLWAGEVAPAAGEGTTSQSTFVVPSGQVFLMGDDRRAAVDSRRFGSVPLSDVLGVARQVWFSSHGGEGVRWNRIGALLK